MTHRILSFLVYLCAGRAAAQDTSRTAGPPEAPSPPLIRLTHPAHFQDLEDIRADSVRALRAALNEYYDRCAEVAGVYKPVVDAVGQEGEYWVVHVAPQWEMLDGDMLVWVHKTSSAVTKVRKWCS